MPSPCGSGEVNSQEHCVVTALNALGFSVAGGDGYQPDAETL